MYIQSTVPTLGEIYKCSISIFYVDKISNYNSWGYTGGSCTERTRNSRRCRHFSGSLNEYINSAELLGLVNRRTCPRSDDERSLPEASFRPAAASSLERRRWRLDWIFYAAFYPRCICHARKLIRNYSSRTSHSTKNEESNGHFDN